MLQKTVLEELQRCKEGSIDDNDYSNLINIINMEKTYVNAIIRINEIESRIMEGDFLI